MIISYPVTLVKTGLWIQSKELMYGQTYAPLFGIGAGLVFIANITRNQDITLMVYLNLYLSQNVHSTPSQLISLQIYLIQTVTTLF